MPCPRCGSETQAGQKFCAECGLALTTACPNCGTPYDGSPKFCAECGYALASQTAAAVATPGRRAAGAHAPESPGAAERRFVTILFADLVGFTTMSEEQDAEEVRDLLSRYFEVARSVIEGYGGSVEKFIGDAVMAVWGAPVAQEDDPERAVRAGLDLVERVRGLKLGERALELRVGVLSGEAAVTPGNVGQGMVAGDIVNTASRLQSVAPGGVVLVGETTQRATSAAIAYEPAGEQLLKGKSAPVAAWRALRVVARVGGAGRDEALEPPFVGREEELRLLKDQLHAAEREHKPRIVAITGQAGLGKSRLVWELEKYLDGLAGPVLYYWHQGRSPAYGEGVTYWALGEMIRRRTGIAESEDESSTRSKLRAALDDFVPDEGERLWLEPALGALLGLDAADWDARERLFSAWRTFFERVAERGPVVLVFEDIQWADSGLLDFIEHLLEWTRDKPMLIVTLARPEILERRPNFGMGHRAFAALHLEPLSDAAMGELLRGVVPSLSDTDLERIVGRAEGVPLYAVESVRALVDTGHLARRGDVYEVVRDLPTLDIPPSLRALIASRLDALDTEHRMLLQDASVIGLVFGPQTLAELSGQSTSEIEARLRRLAAKEFVTLEADPRSPERGQYRFTQGVLREVAYSTLAKRERRSRHLAAARYFETLGDDELASVLANHYLEAYRAAPTGEEGAAVAAQARVALRAAAERAARLHSPEHALALYEEAIAVTTTDDDAAELREHAGLAAVESGAIEKADELYRSALAWYQSQSNWLRAGQVAARLAHSLIVASRIEEAIAVIRPALERLGPEDAPAAELNGQLGRALLFLDEPRAAMEALERALEHAERASLRRTLVQVLITKGWALQANFRPQEGIALLIGAKQIADEGDDLFAQLRSRFNLSSFLGAEDPRSALELAYEGLALGERYGSTLHVVNMAGNATSAAFSLGRFDEILELEKRGGTHVNAPLSLFASADAGLVLALRGEWPAALERLAAVEQAVATSSSKQDQSGLRFVKAVIALAEGDLVEAARRARQARDSYVAGAAPTAAVLAAQVDALLTDQAALAEDLEPLRALAPFGAWVVRGIRTAEAALLALTGRRDEARIAYRQAVAEWRAGENKWELALTLLGQAQVMGPSDPEAQSARESARELFVEMGIMPAFERITAALPAPTEHLKPSPTAPSVSAAVARR